MVLHSQALFLHGCLAGFIMGYFLISRILYLIMHLVMHGKIETSNFCSEDFFTRMQKIFSYALATDKIFTVLHTVRKYFYEHF